MRKYVQNLPIKVAWLLMLIFLSTGNLFSQGTIQIGSGTTTTTTYPMSSCWGYSYTQQIYLASEFASVNGVAGDITSMRFYFASGTVASNWTDNWVVYIGHTTQNEFASTTDWVPLANLNQVFSGNVVPVAGNWMEITFSTPFNYDGVSNIVIAIDENTPLYTCSANWRSFTPATSNRGMYYRSDTVNPDPASPPAGVRSGTAAISQIQFEGQLANCSLTSLNPVTDITTNSATISWNEATPVPTNGYEWEVRSSGTGGSGAIGLESSGTTVSLSENVIGLSASTTFNVYVRSFCDIGDYSAWAGPVAFTTLCAPFTATYTQNFDAVSIPNLPNCWTNIVQSTSSLAVVRTVTSNNPTSTPNQIEMYNSATAGATSHLMLVSPAFTDLAAGTNWLKFKARRGTNEETMTVGTLSDPSDPTTFTPITTINNLTTIHQEYYIPFDTYAGTDSHIAFRHDNSTQTRYIYIDDVVWEPIPACILPLELTQIAISETSFEFSWSMTGNASEWTVEWGAPGFTPGTGTELGTVTVTTNSVEITGLTPNTNYAFYVQADCDTDGLSDWSSPISAYTGYCIPVYTSTADYTSKFETTGALSNVLYTATSQPPGGYANLTSETIVHYAGSQFNFETNYVGGSNTVKIWVDWNNNLLFEESEVVHQAYVTGVPLNAQFGSILVPAGIDPGNYRMRVRSRFSTTVPGPCSSETWGSALDFTLAIIEVPVSPTPTQDPAIPTCDVGTELMVTGTPDPGVEWYWQETANGTSFDNEYTGPYTVFTNGTYYIRAYEVTYGYWANADSVVVTNMPTATSPPAPVASINPACFTTGSELTVDSAPAGVGYFWQGTTEGGTSGVNSASTPLDVTTTGTYYVAAYDSTTLCWSNTVGLEVIVGQEIPSSPQASQTMYFACEGDPSIEIGGDITASTEQTITTLLSAGNGCGGGAMFNITALTGDIVVNALDIVPNTTGVQNVNVYTKSGTYAGSETVAANWTLVGTYSITGTNGVVSNIDVDDFTIPAGETHGIYVNFSAAYTTIPVGTNYTDGDVTITVGAGLCGNFATVNQGRAFNGRVYYTRQIPVQVEWFDADDNENSLGFGNILEAVGTSVLPTATLGDYNFYAFTELEGCYSTSGVEITVSVSNVNVELAQIAAICNNGSSGSFSVTDTLCGVAPFTYSIDGGTFGSLPTNLTPGEHTVVIMDNDGNLSGEYTIFVEDAPAPSDLEVVALTSDGGTFTWTANGLELFWNVEWGIPGFTPGQGEEIGSDVVGTNEFILTGVDPNTTYDIYVSANCGVSDTPGTWISITFTTLCSAITAQGWCENFDPSSETKACWTVLNENNDADAWNLNYTLNTYSGSNVAILLTDFNNGNNDDWLITPQLTLTGNEVFSFFYRVQSAAEPNDFRVMLSTTGTNPADFTETLMDLASYNNIVYQDTAINLSAYTGNVFIAFHVPPGGLDGWRLYIDQVCVDICTPNASQSGAQDVCRLDGNVDLNTVIVPGENYGTWSFTANPGLLSGSNLNISALPGGSYQAMYVVTTACPEEADTVYASINVYGPSTAGNNGTVQSCNYGPLNLFDGLSGTVDLGGTWYDPAGNPLPNAIVNFNGQIPANYNYYYITSNNVCPADTSFVEVQLQNCASIAENELSGFALYPNPTSDIINIQYSGVAITANLVLVDTKGSVIYNEKVNLASDDSIEMDLSTLEKGVYFLNIYGENGSKVIKVVRN